MTVSIFSCFFGFPIGLISTMDSDRLSGSSSSSVAMKFRLCRYGKRMSNITKNFCSICIDCKGIDCDIDNRCNECVNIETNIMTDYIRHKSRLKSKLKYRRKVKEPLLSESVIDDPSVVRDVPSSIDVLSASLDVPSVNFPFSDTNKRVNSKLSEVKDELSGQIHSFFDNFTRHMDVKLFRQNTYLRNKKHTLTCQGGNWLL